MMDSTATYLVNHILVLGRWRTYTRLVECMTRRLTSVHGTTLYLACTPLANVSSLVQSFHSSVSVATLPVGLLGCWESAEWERVDGAGRWR